MQLKRIAWCMGTLILASLIGLLFVPFDSNTPWDAMAIGYFYAIFFTQPTLAATWTGLGPGPVAIRLLGSAIWLLATAVFSVLSVLFAGMSLSESVLPIAVLLLAQWLILQPLFWILSRVGGFSIRSATTMNPEHQAKQAQFGIWHLLILMTGIALLLVVARALQPHLELDTLVFLGFFATVNIVSQVPFALALLLRQHVLAAGLLACVFVAVFTIIEYPIFDALTQDADDFGYAIMIATNVLSSVFTATAAVIVRLHGFLLLGPSREVLPLEGSEAPAERQP